MCMHVRICLCVCAHNWFMSKYLYGLICYLFVCMHGAVGYVYMIK